MWQGKTALDRRACRAWSGRRRKLCWRISGGDAGRAFLVEDHGEGLVMLAGVTRSPALHARITLGTLASRPPHAMTARVTGVEPLSTELVLITARYEPQITHEVSS